jgi:hypothetical protein
MIPLIDKANAMKPDWENGANKAKSDIFMSLKAIMGDAYMGDYQDLIQAIDDLIKVRIREGAEIDALLEG